MITYVTTREVREVTIRVEHDEDTNPAELVDFLYHQPFIELTEDDVCEEETAIEAVPKENGPLAARQLSLKKYNYCYESKID